MPYKNPYFDSWLLNQIGWVFAEMQKLSYSFMILQHYHSDTISKAIDVESPIVI